MIQTPTVFVVGAGGSEPFALPLASELRKSAKTLEPAAAVYRLIQDGLNIGASTLNSILGDFAGYPGPSLDDFLEKRRRQAETGRVGRALIAAFMGQRIRDKATPPLREPKDQDWIKYIHQQMHEGADTFDDFCRHNVVTFATFNFDSIIEERLSLLTSRIYPEEYDASRMFASVKVIHIHGQLPTPPAPPLGFDRALGGVQPDWVAWLPGAAESVKVTADTIDDDELGPARDAILNAHHLCFLGFSYHRTNLKRLWSPALDRGERIVVGSAFGLATAERQRALNRLRVFTGRRPKEPIMGTREEKCLAVLKEHFVFAD